METLEKNIEREEQKGSDLETKSKYVINFRSIFYCIASRNNTLLMVFFYNNNNSVVVYISLLFFAATALRLYSFGEYKAEDQEEMLHSLDKKVAEVYNKCIGGNEATVK